MIRVAPARLLIAAAAGCLALALALHGGDTDRTWFLTINDAAWRWVLPAALSCITLLGHGLSATMLMAPTLLRAPGLMAAGLCATPVALLLSLLPKAVINSPRPAAVRAGAGVGLVAGLAGTQAAKRWRFCSRPTAQAVMALIVLTCAVILGRIDLGYPLARPLQLVLAGVGVAVAAAVAWRMWAGRSAAA